VLNEQVAPRPLSPSLPDLLAPERVVEALPVLLVSSSGLSLPGGSEKDVVSEQSPGEAARLVHSRFEMTWASSVLIQVNDHHLDRVLEAWKHSSSLAPERLLG